MNIKMVWLQPSAASAPIFWILVWCICGLYCRLYMAYVQLIYMAHIWLMYDLHMAHILTIYGHIWPCQGLVICHLRSIGLIMTVSLMQEDIVRKTMTENKVTNKRREFRFGKHKGTRTDAKFCRIRQDTSGRASHDWTPRITDWCHTHAREWSYMCMYVLPCTAVPTRTHM